ncbi:EAL domain-containing response regulator [Pseudomonas lactis]|uniref:Cyclic diguanylate phosphodiesterase (EAL) domain protein n=1 Tax=Pseudomonas lactis TaxID=1615674 RepID=I4K9P9_9PSED|nr:EAL domain-containing response regulator [Pseudomonas lactis]EIK61439.1 cyclic diguanylate phosphodiesterase (EAL) domain protein [Pseudomonas lactis]
MQYEKMAIAVCQKNFNITRTQLRCVNRMISFRVMVLGNQASQSEIVVGALSILGVLDVIHVSCCEKAMVTLCSSHGVDILVCDLTNEKLKSFEFLLAVGRARLVSAIVLSSALEPQLLRAIEQIHLFSKIQLIGVMDAADPVKSLGSILHSYTRRITLSLSLPPTSSKLPTEPEVRKGLTAGEFKAWFQPKFNLCDDKLSGVEALVRWEHPGRGLLLPQEFLSAVLAYDLIDEMFEQVFAQGLDLVIWLSQRNLQMPISFNLHTSQLASSGLMSFIENELIERGLHGSSVIFELAENSLLDMPTTIMRGSLQLHSLGCKLAIDDFGVGFSSLTMLCQLPFTQLKLDGSRVRDLDDHSSKAMVACAVALAEALNMSLIVEGVSTQEIRDQVKAMGGTLAQGFHLAQPMSALSLKEWLVS